jgi:hypothetical protein
VEENMGKCLLIRPYTLLAIPAILSAALVVLPGAVGSAPQPSRAVPAGPAQKGGIVTLYALDPVASTFCFADGEYGQVLSDQGVGNRCSDIAFDSFKKSSFTVGVEGSVIGTILDLGTAQDLQKRYGGPGGVGGNHGFASIHRKEQAVFTDGPEPIKESAQVFRQGGSNASAQVKFGHIYLVRLTGERGKPFEYVVKMMVIAYTPDQLVTIRWEMLG